MVQRAEKFFNQWRSTTSLPKDVILRENRDLLAGDPRAGENLIFPDNTLKEFTFQFEVERYGGSKLLHYSLDFFALSSIQAFRFLETYYDKSVGLKLAQIIRLLIRQAWGFARDEVEFLVLLEYSIAYWGNSLEGAVTQGNLYFEQHQKNLCKLLLYELETLSSMYTSSSFWQNFPQDLAKAANRLSQDIWSAGEVQRLNIGTSQMHMTANRLGLFNSEEVYLSQILRRAAQKIIELNSSAWNRIWNSRNKPEVIINSQQQSFRGLLEEAFRELCSS